MKSSWDIGLISNHSYSEDAAAAAKSLQLCLTLSDLMDSSPPGSAIHGIFQATVLEWGAIAFSAKDAGLEGIILPTGHNLRMQN